MRAMMTVHRFFVKKKFAMNPNSEPTNNVTKPNTMSFFSETKSPREP